jgi:hypothetical protein
MEVEDVLACERSRVLAQVDADGSELVAHDPGQSLGQLDGGGSLRRLDGPDVPPVGSGHDQRVAPGRRRLAQEREHVVARVDDFLLASAGDDLAERTGLGLLHVVGDPIPAASPP